MLLIGGAAGAASFRHVHDVAAAHGQPGWLAWADAVVLELTSIAAGLELRRNRRLGKSVAFPATVLTVAVFLSLAAQVVGAEPSVIGWIAAALPALGFLAMVKIALGRADPAPLRRTAPPAPSNRSGRSGRSGPVSGTDATVPDAAETVPGPAAPVHPGTATVPDSTPAVTATALGGQSTVPDRRNLHERVRDGGPEIEALVPVARTAARALAAQGTPLSRKALARQLRADGHQLSNATASALVRVLRAEPTPPRQLSPDLSPADVA
ncbi:DUF2637 domain-containing protein [Micromonospora craniellae]|uniref:DUF2637 domain-containing protein n=2 Tax=Micromonospora craniellae TaxID=2294034 RepID=A0A372FQU1_9ACTN|nr:DUF2637 domain-containing protein [Micromonospora craniellae]RFS40514.1 DUF2637 domain-containing protein [Micromonospora craniellae]